ncbi:MAG TPA: hypothetical protein VJM53_06275, partial [Burkholderiales bacterium]|nr:hypothetical protein [Burkholderiales bacterium]
MNENQDEAREGGDYIARCSLTARQEGKERMRAWIRAAIAVWALCALSTASTVYAETRIREIQGRGHTSPMLGAKVQAVPGVITATRANGFFMQDPEPDEDLATSEALFVLSRGEVKVGEWVLVTGRVAEYVPGGPKAETYLTQTELIATSVKTQGSDHPLPPPMPLGVGGRVVPERISPKLDDGAQAFDPQSSALDFYESMEGMRVRVLDAIVVGPTNAGGEAVIAPVSLAKRSARGTLTIGAENFHSERIMLDDVWTPLPVARVGDRLGDVEGILTYAFGHYVLYPTTMPLLQAGRLAPEFARDPGTGELSIASFNVENLDARDPPGKFEQLARQIVQHLKSPEIVGLLEVQDDNGAIDNGQVSADETLQKLVNVVATLGGPRYHWRSVDPMNNADGGEPGANIRPVLLFDPARIEAVDRNAGGANLRVLEIESQAALSRSPGRVAPWHPAYALSRKPLAVEFRHRGRPLFVFLNHFNSKRGDEPLFGRRQPPYRDSEARRAEQASV